MDGDFKISKDEKPAGPCIWHGCKMASAVVLECTEAPLSMDVCMHHAEKLLKTKVVPDGDGAVAGLSVAGVFENDKDDLPE